MSLRKKLAKILKEKEREEAKEMKRSELIQKNRRRFYESGITEKIRSLAEEMNEIAKGTYVFGVGLDANGRRVSLWERSTNTNHGLFLFFWDEKGIYLRFFKEARGHPPCRTYKINPERISKNYIEDCLEWLMKRFKFGPPSPY